MSASKLVAAVAVAFSLMSATFAGDLATDRGRQLLPRLFESAAASACDATVRVQSNNKDVALGTVVTKDGYILTKGSELLAREGKIKSNISCVMRDGSIFDANVKGYHLATDLMLLKVDAQVLSPVTFAESKEAEAGNWVVATGYKNNSRSGDTDSIEPISVGVLSTTTRPLFFQEAQIENGNRGFLGIVFEMSRDLKNTRIEEVKNPGAIRAGLKKGDAIVAVNETVINAREDLFKFMSETRPGETIEVKVKRKPKTGDEDEELTFKFSTIHQAGMDRGIMQNVMGSLLSDRRTGFPQVIQHDTLLSPQQCGGPLVDLEGRVIGLNIARAGRVESWALPGELVTAELKDLKAGKYPYPKIASAAKVEVKTDDTKDKK